MGESLYKTIAVSDFPTLALQCHGFGVFALFGRFNDIWAGV
jgi:hypothetical protein